MISAPTAETGHGGPGNPASAGLSFRAQREIRPPCHSGEARGVEDAAPYGGKVPVLSLRDQLCISSGNQICRAEACIFGPSLKCAHWRGNPHPPSPLPMFSNGNLKTPQFSIFNSQFSIRPFGVRRALDKRPYGGDGARRVRGTAGAGHGGCGVRRVRGTAGRRGRRPLRCKAPRSVIARPVRRLVVAIRIPRPLMPDELSAQSGNGERCSPLRAGTGGYGRGSAGGQ